MHAAGRKYDQWLFFAVYAMRCRYTVNKSAT